MKYFINPEDSALFAYEEDGSQDEFIPQTFVAATAEQIAAVVSPPPSPNASVLAQIVLLEATITPRRLREATLTVDGKTWLEVVDAQIAALRVQLV
jgi:hypothetical protein